MNILFESPKVKTDYYTETIYVVEVYNQLYPITKREMDAKALMKDESYRCDWFIYEYTAICHEAHDVKDIAFSFVDSDTEIEWNHD